MVIEMDYLSAKSAPMQCGRLLPPHRLPASVLVAGMSTFSLKIIMSRGFAKESSLTYIAAAHDFSCNRRRVDSAWSDVHMVFLPLIERVHSSRRTLIHEWFSLCANGTT